MQWKDCLPWQWLGILNCRVKVINHFEQEISSLQRFMNLLKLRIFERIDVNHRRSFWEGMTNYFQVINLWNVSLKQRLVCERTCFSSFLDVVRRRMTRNLLITLSCMVLIAKQTWFHFINRFLSMSCIHFPWLFIHNFLDKSFQCYVSVDERNERKRL